MNAPLSHGTVEGRALDVRLAEDADRAVWDDYVMAHEEGTFFHRYGWAGVIESTYGHKPLYLIAQDGQGAVAGLLPLIHVKSPLFGKALISTAFTVGGGIIADHPGAELALLEAAERLGRERGVDYVELRGGPGGEGWLDKAETYAGFISDIPESEDDTLKMIPRKKRADVRKGIKAAEAGKLTVSRDGDIDTFYALYAESLRNLGTPVLPKKLIATLVAAFGEAVDITVVRAEETPVAALLSFWHGDTVLPYYGGATPAARGLHAYDFMYFSQMRHAREERGVTRFDYGRSKVGTGAYDFKRYWGFEPQPLTYHYKLVKAAEMPDVNPNNPKYKLMTQAWQKLPLPVANMIGPHIARQLG